ncbi:hypothetical protein ER45_028810 (plasmid) [Bacillus mycoides]|nr:hypothetical protein ER45_028810 [Bacillus mycoides]
MLEKNYFGSGGPDGFTGKDENDLLPNEMAMSWIKVNGVDYYFSKDEDALQVDGRILDVGGMAKYFQKIQGNTYYFARSRDGAGSDFEGQLVKGWKDLRGAKYHFGGTGVMTIGLQTVDGKQYYFGEGTTISTYTLLGDVWGGTIGYTLGKDITVKVGTLLQRSQIPNPYFKYNV